MSSSDAHTDLSKALSLDSAVIIEKQPVPAGIVFLAVCICSVCKHRARLRCCHSLYAYTAYTPIRYPITYL